MKRYYHIQNLDGKNKVWLKNESVNINGKNFNNYYRDLIKSTGEKIGNNDLFKFAEQKENEVNAMPLILNRNSPELLNQYVLKSSIYGHLSSVFNSSLSQYLKWIREEIFENYRKEKFPHLPSRKTCLWLCEQKDLDKWFGILYPNNRKKIIELTLGNNAKIHCGNGSLIISETLNVSDYGKLANKYWQGKMHKNCEVETLFEGRFKVINEFNNIFEI
ncbi:DUF2441 domain-containing protein [Flavobacterium sp. HJSW_4]|uniref:DUF2441 domain-containing protein n=1 Tax=Flavobacterium sp. HJSW_4 TaxID=3344660 RepID=UPI0035F338CE